MKSSIILKLLSVVFSSLILVHPFSLKAEPAGQLADHGIEHVVILMLENRSFDNILAWLYDNGAKPDHFIPETTEKEFKGLTEDTLWKYTNTLKDLSGNVVFSCPPIKGVPSIANTKFLNSPRYNPHEAYPHVLWQIYGFEGSTEPTMTGFLQDYASMWHDFELADSKTDLSAVMETYTANELPIFHHLGRHYAVSDMWFSSVPTQTNPNRAFTFCGTSTGQTVNGVLANSDFFADTLWNRLYEFSPETTWKIFWQCDMIPGVFLGPYSGINTFNHFDKIPAWESHFETIENFHTQARNGSLPHVSFIEPIWTLSLDLHPKDHDELPFMVLQQLTTEKRYEFVTALQGNDCHPPGDMRSSMDLIANIYTSLTANPETWNKTLFIITFDEHGGLFDHVPPPKAIRPDDLCEDGFCFDLYGVRVPTLFISPKIKKGTVVRSDDPLIPFDHTSLIASILKWRGVDKSSWQMGNRVDAAPSFETVITLDTPRHDIILGLDPQSDVPTYDLETLYMDQPFCIRNKDGKYLTKNILISNQYATVGSASRKIGLKLISGCGPVTHGSFCLLQTQDTSLGEHNLLGCTWTTTSCQYDTINHSSAQWWTVKSVDHPYIGYPIRYGDRVYLELQDHLNTLQYVPGRLRCRDGLLSFFLVVEDITAPGSEDNYWVIERP